MSLNFKSPLIDITNCDVCVSFWMLISCFLGCGERCENKNVGAQLNRTFRTIIQMAQTTHSHFSVHLGLELISFSYLQCSFACSFDSVWFSRPCGNWYVGTVCASNVILLWNHAVLNETVSRVFDSIGVNVRPTCMHRNFHFVSSMAYRQIDVWLRRMLKPSVPDAFHTFHCSLWQQSKTDMCVQHCHIEAKVNHRLFRFIYSFIYMMWAQATHAHCASFQYKLSHY